MADLKEVFNILEDGTGEGAALSKKQVGDAAAGSNNAAVLPSVDSAGNLQHATQRSEGEAASAGAPSLVAKDASGNFVYLTLDAEGKLPVSGETPGTEIKGNGTVISNPGTDVEVLSLTGLTISKSHMLKFVVGASTKTVLWKIQVVNDASTTTILEFITGSGQYSKEINTDLMFTTGAIGTQEINLIGNQIGGSASDLHGTMKIVESA